MSRIPGKQIILDTDPTLSNNSDTEIASQKAVKSYVDNTVLITTLDLNFITTEEFVYNVPKSMKYKSITTQSGTNAILKRNDVITGIGDTWNQYDTIIVKVNNPGLVTIEIETSTLRQYFNIGA